MSVPTANSIALNAVIRSLALIDVFNSLHVIFAEIAAGFERKPQLR
jgi:hypothetical protein